MKLRVRRFVTGMLVVAVLLVNGPVVWAQEEATPSATVATESAVLDEVTIPAATVAGDLVLPPGEVILSEGKPIVEMSEPVIPTAAPSARIIFPVKVQNLKKKNFRAGEKVTVVVENTLSENVEVAVFDVDGRKVNVEAEVVSDYDPTVIRISPPAQFRAGRYRIKVTDPGGNVTVQDFTWGVLAINVNKSIYLPGETAKLALAVLDETGMMVCDANVKLEIRNPNSEVVTLSTADGTIKVNPECQVKDITEKPDYEASYVAGGIGVYEMNLVAETGNGKYDINDNFEVREDVPFDVERIAHTRIFPPKTYPVIFDVLVNEDFEGEVRELVPASFAVSQQEGVKSYERVESVLSASTEVLEAPIFGLVPPFDGVYPITLGFGEQIRDPLVAQKYSDFGLLGHDGIDFGLPEGTAVLAVDDGKIARVRENGDYGKTVVIEHSWGKSYYGHLSLITVNEGDEIIKGHPMGLSGSTGLSSGPHLHFGIKPNDNDSFNGYYGKINPLPYLNLTDGNQNVLGSSTERAGKPVASSVLGEQVVVWNVSAKKGERIRLGYSYEAPHISPQFFLLGPLEFKNGGGERVFQEARRWQLAIDADGAGTNSVLPTTGQPSTTGNTYTFTFTATEQMDSGKLQLTVPSSGSPNWSAPQGTAGTAGYTQATAGSGAAIADTATELKGEGTFSGGTLTEGAGVWEEDPANLDSCSTTTTQTLQADTTNFKEGSQSVQCPNSGVTTPDNGDSFGYVYTSTQDFSSYETFGVWFRSSVNITGTGTLAIIFYTGTLATAAAGGTFDVYTLNGSAQLNANTWYFLSGSLTGVTRTVIKSWGVEALAVAGLDSKNINLDDFMVGNTDAMTPTFAGAGPWTIDLRILDLDNTETIQIVYGSGGGASGVQNSSTTGAHTFTTKSQVSAIGTLTAIASSPTVTLAAGPTTDQQMRHGNWFNSGAEQSFTF